MCYQQAKKPRVQATRFHSPPPLALLFPLFPRLPWNLRPSSKKAFLTTSFTVFIANDLWKMIN